jgi:hypothetical protein
MEVSAQPEDTALYAAEGLVPSNVRTLMMEANSFAGSFVPRPGDTIVWPPAGDSYRYTVKAIRKQIAPDGSPILFYIGIER